MNRRELDTVGALIEWAVAPAPPLPTVAETDVVLAFARNFDCGSRPERLGLRALLACLELLPLLARDHRRLHACRGNAAPAA